MILKDLEGDQESLFEASMEVHGIDWIAVFAYFDETGAHDSAPDTVAAGYVFSKDGAKKFRQMFDANILPLLPPNKHGQRIFRATKCVLGYDQFAALTVPQRERIVDLMVDAIKASVTFGVVVGMEKQEYAKALTASPALREVVGDEYAVCLIRCIENLAGRLDHDNVQGRIEYVFEAGCPHQNEASAILGNISLSPELKKRYRWHDYAFRDKSPDVPQLFAADLLAWEWQRARINSLNPQRGEWRLTLKKLMTGTSHIAEYQNATSIGIRALINSAYGITKSKNWPQRISI